uniref:Uncharacterized protein n=1 Tax=Rhabditophanes sp. KR3021 TaxID=114890 RepID=A0AC35U0X9_9BILA
MFSDEYIKDATKGINKLKTGESITFNLFFTSNEETFKRKVKTDACFKSQQATHSPSKSRQLENEENRRKGLRKELKQSVKDRDIEEWKDELLQTIIP